MPYHGEETSRLYRYMAVIGFLAIPVGVLIQYLIPNDPLTGLGISIMPAGSFLMIYGILFYYMDTTGNTELPHSIMPISYAAMVLGVLLSAVPVFVPSLYLTLELPGPLIFAVGFVLSMTMIQRKYEIRMRSILILSLILDAIGLAVPLAFNLFIDSPYLALAIIPVISGVYMLFIPITRKTFASWQRMGYFQ